MLKEDILKYDGFIDNDYLIKYVDLINNNSDTVKVRGETHKHHIIPRCWYRLNNVEIDNTDNNLVNLPIKYHILAHYYLQLSAKGDLKIHLYHAYNMLLTVNNTDMVNAFGEEWLLDNLQYLEDSVKAGNVRTEEWKNKIKASLIGHNVSEEARIKISLAHINKEPHNKNTVLINNGNIHKYVNSDELDNFISNGWVKGRIPVTEEQKLNYSKGQTGLIHIIKGNELKHINPDMLEEYLIDGWVVGSRKVDNNLKEKVSKANSNRVHIFNGNSNKFVKSDELDYYLSNGWLLGNNSLKGKTLGIWYNNGINKVYINKDESYIFDNLGWIRGRGKGLIAVSKYDIIKELTSERA